VNTHLGRILSTLRRVRKRDDIRNCTEIRLYVSLVATASYLFVVTTFVSSKPFAPLFTGETACDCNLTTAPPESIERLFALSIGEARVLFLPYLLQSFGTAPSTSIGEVSPLLLYLLHSRCKPTTVSVFCVTVQKATRLYVVLHYLLCHPRPS
jgi:hypothetical protein